MAGSAEASAHFRRLLAQRCLFGQLAECQRSHHGENTNTAMLDDIVDILTHELEIRFPDAVAGRSNPSCSSTEAATAPRPHRRPGCRLRPLSCATAGARPAEPANPRRSAAPRHRPPAHPPGATGPAGPSRQEAA